MALIQYSQGEQAIGWELFITLIKPTADHSITAGTNAGKLWVHVIVTAAFIALLNQQSTTIIFNSQPDDATHTTRS